MVGIRHTSSATSTVMVIGLPGLRDLDAVDRERQQRHRRQQEHQRQLDQQNPQRDLVGRLLPARALDHRDHAIEECLAGIDRHAHDEPVGEHARAAGDRAEVAARFADHRRGLAGDRAFVDRGDAFDHLAVGRDDLARLDQEHIALAQVGRRRPSRTQRRAARPSSFLRRRPRASTARSAAACALLRAFGDRLGEVGEQHREPQPQRDREDEAGRRFAVAVPAPGRTGTWSGCCRRRPRTSPDCATGAAAAAWTNVSISACWKMLLVTSLRGSVGTARYG